MESHKIKQLLEKYFEGVTSIQEEKELKQYFSSSNIAPELKQYQDLFGYFHKQKNVQSQRPLQIKSSKKIKWLWAVASIVILLGLGTPFLKPKPMPNLGSFDSPELALEETHKALSLIAENLNQGKQKMQYIQEYENTKKYIFKN